MKNLLLTGIVAFVIVGLAATYLLLFYNHVESPPQIASPAMAPKFRELASPINTDPILPSTTTAETNSPKVFEPRRANNPSQIVAAVYSSARTPVLNSGSASKPNNPQQHLATPKNPAPASSFQVGAAGTSQGGDSPAGISALPSTPEVTEEVVSVPMGARLPAALVDSATDVTPEQATVLDNLADDFLDSTNPATTSGTGQTQTSDEGEGTWGPALAEADERYRALFGADAYNAWTSAAAKEALAEKQ